MPRPSGWIGVDFDGTLAQYDPARPLSEIGEPIQPMLDRVRGWLNQGYDVRVVTARVGSTIAPPERSRQYRLVQDWCSAHVEGWTPLVTDRKDFSMIALYDDRAVAVETNTGQLLGGTEILGLLLAVLLWALPATAQTLDMAVLASSHLVGPIKLSPTQEVLLFQNKAWRHVLFFGVPHPTKHGVAGSLPGPGLCLDAGPLLPFMPDVVVITDLDNNGAQEIVATAGTLIHRESALQLAQCGAIRRLGQ